MTTRVRRMPGNLDNYIKDGNGARCRTCDAEILAATVTHSIHLPGGALGGMAGFGEVQTERVPYCPNCEEKPSPYGAPIYYS